MSRTFLGGDATVGAWSGRRGLIIPRMFRWRVPSRTLALGWALVLVLLIRMATNGSFSHVTLQWEPRSRALLSGAGIVVSVLAVGLTVALALWPTRRLLGASLVLGVGMVPFGIAAFPLHGSAVAVVLLGLMIAVASWLGRRDSDRHR